MSDRKMTKEEAIMKAAKDDFDRINALPDSERRQEAIRSIYGGMETFSPPAPVSIDDKVHAVSLASEVPGHEKRGVIGHYKIHHNGDREGTVLGNWDWERVVADAGLTGKWMVLHFTDANDFERDWSMLDATQDSLREHAKLLKQRDSQINYLRAEVEELKLELHNTHVDRALAESEVEALKAKLAEAKKDSERLDFLADSNGDGHFTLTQKNGFPEFDVEVWYDGEWLVGEGTDLRSVIDAARPREGGA